MGFKLQGILVRSDFGRDPQEILRRMGITEYEQTNNVTFEAATSDFPDRNYIQIGYLNGGTIIMCDDYFISHDEIKENLSEGTEAGCFWEYDTINAFAFDLFRDREKIRRYYYIDPDNGNSYYGGSPLHFETKPVYGDDLDRAEADFRAFSRYMIGAEINDLDLEMEFIDYNFKFSYPSYKLDIFTTLSGKKKIADPRPRYWVETFG